MQSAKGLQEKKMGRTRTKVKNEEIGAYYTQYEGYN